MKLRTVLAYAAAEIALDLAIERLQRWRAYVRRPVTVPPPRRAKTHAYLDGQPLPRPQRVPHEGLGGR